METKTPNKSDEEDNGPPPLKERNDNDESSVDSDDEEDIDWDSEDLIPEFQKTYQDQKGKQAK